MNPELIVTFTMHIRHEDMALLPKVIAGEIRRGSRSGSVPEYAGEHLPGSVGLP